MWKFMLEEQRREVRFGGLGENEVLLVRTINFKSWIRNFKGEKSFLKQDKRILESWIWCIQFHEEVGAQQLRPRSTYSIQRVWLAIKNIAKVLQLLSWIGTLGKKVPIHFMTKAKWWRKTFDQCHGRWVLKNLRFLKLIKRSC